MRIANILDSSDQLMLAIERYDREVAASLSSVELRGKTLEEANMEQGMMLLKYQRLHSEVKNLGRMLEARGSQLKIRRYEHVRKTSDHALSDRMIEKFVDGDQSVLDHYAIVVELKSIEEQLAAVVEALKMRGYALNNITKARIENVHMAVL